MKKNQEESDKLLKLENQLLRLNQQITSLNSEDSNFEYLQNAIK
jgi:hypothetical protein